jgi:hypothetical protein
MEVQLTVTFGNGMVKRSIALVVGRIQWASVLEKEVHHWHRADSGRAMDRILAPAIANPSRCAILDKNAGNVEVLLGGDEMKGSLYVSTCVRLLAWFRLEVRSGWELYLTSGIFEVQSVVISNTKQRLESYS